MSSGFHSQRMFSLAHAQRQTPLLQFEHPRLTEENGVSKIRLLEILPGDAWEGAGLWSGATNSQHLKCWVEAVEFQEDMPEYSALSYYWGDANDCVTIQCNGQLLSITRNLCSALDAIRRRPAHPTRYIWADGICINQNNKREQAQQIPLMSKLYQRAAQVFVYLGQSDSDLEPALAAIRKSASANFTHHGASALRMSPQDWWSLGYQSVEEAKIQLRAFYKFLQRPWFTRVWVIQEYAMAKSLIFLCGNHQILEADLMNASAWLASSSADTIVAEWASNSMILLHGIKSEQRAELKRPLLNLLADFRHRGAKRPHDKIYALYGLASDSGTGSEGLNIKPDYDVPVPDVYKELATEFLCKDRSLEVVTLAGVYEPAVPPGMVKSRYPSLPSWVADWRLPDSTVSVQLLEQKKPLHWDTSTLTPTYMFPFDLDPTEFRASGKTIYTPAFSDDGDSLCVQGMILDSIRGIGVPNDEYTSVPQQWWAEPPASALMDKISRTADRLCNWIDLVGGESGRYYFNGEQMLDVFWQTMRCGHYPHGFQRERQGFMDWYIPIRPIMEIIRRCRSQPWLRNNMLMEYNNYAVSIGVYGASTSFVARTNQHTGNRAMFSTNYGYVGMAPKGSRVGDQVAIFEGGSVPFIIRPWGQNWQVVGACYVHGCMHGQVFSPEKTKQMMLV